MPNFDLHVSFSSTCVKSIDPAFVFFLENGILLTTRPKEKPSASSAEEPASNATTPPAGAAGGKAGAGAPATLAAAADGGDPEQGDGMGLPGSSKRKTFYVEPETLELAIGETTEVRVWAFPTEVRVYKDTLIACLTDNPRPVLFPVSCSGAAPLMVLEGPWDKILSAEQTALEELGSLEVRGVGLGTGAGRRSHP